MPDVSNESKSASPVIDETTTDPAAAVPLEQSLHGRLWSWTRSYLDSYAEPALKVVGVLSLLWSVVLFLISPNRYDLQIWIDEMKTVYPSRDTKDLELPLSYDGIRASTVKILTVGVQNQGSEAIGELNSKWTLSLGLPKASRLQVVKVLRKRPSSIQFSQRRSISTNQIEFDVGVLQPRARIDLVIIAIYEMSARFERLRVRTSLPGLPIEDSGSAPKTRLATKFILPLWIAAFLILGVPDALRHSRAKALEDALARVDRERRRLDEESERLRHGVSPAASASRLIKKLLVSAALCLFIAMTVAVFLGWLLSFFM
jgi:hypothetical protein